MPKQRTILPILALILASVFWGANAVFIKIGVASMPVPIFMAIRFLIASAILLPFAIKNWRPLTTKEFLLLSLSSIFYISLSALALNIALTKTSASNAAIIYLLEPIVLLVLSASFLKERINVLTFVGICVAIVGSLVIIGKPGVHIGNNTELTGNLLVVIAGFCFAVSTLICKPLTKQVSVQQLTFMNILPGTLPITAYALVQLPKWNIATTNTTSWRALVASIVSVIFANLLFFFALNYKRAQDTGVYQYLEAISTIIVARILLAEQPTVNFILGAGLVFLGVYIAEFYKLQKTN